MSLVSWLFSSRSRVFSIAFLLRLVLLVYGLYQDAHSAIKYTDIDYYVFTDAASYLASGRSPYERATYRYTPLLAWLLYPTTWGGLWFHFGKALFASSDILAGWLMLEMLRRRGIAEDRALQYASIWLLNPMVATISTRGSSEGLLCVLVVALLWAFEAKRIAAAGMLLGLGVHLKIYPFIYGVSMLCALPTTTPIPQQESLLPRLLRLINVSRTNLVTTSLAIFTLLNLTMYTVYGHHFIQHTFLYHVTRLDHRHNFSPYNTLLYLTSSRTTTSNLSSSISRLAFLPQLLLTTILIPLAQTPSNPKFNSDLSTTLLAQTLAFVTFNKVCTSQYFLWYLVFLPLYLPTSPFIHQPKLGVLALALWAGSQAVWLQQAYRLEFLGESTFVFGLWGAGLLFLGVNCWILGIICQGLGGSAQHEHELELELEARESSEADPSGGTDTKIADIGTNYARKRESRSSGVPKTIA